MENENQVIDMKKEIQIRKMKKSDLPQLQEMYRDLIPEGVSMEVLENNYYRTVDRPEYFLAVAAVIRCLAVRWELCALHWMLHSLL